MGEVLGRDRTCPVANTLALVGDSWTLLVLREAFAGRTRFAEFRSALAVSPAVLSRRLADLVEARLLERHPYRPAGSRGRYEYRLSAAGRDLLPVLAALGDWGLTHRPRSVDSRTRFRRRDDGARVTVRLVDEADRVVAPDEVVLRPH